MKIYGTYVISVNEDAAYRKPKVKGIYEYPNIKINTVSGEQTQIVRTKEFSNKDEFVGFIVQQAVDAWETYESEKEFAKLAKDIDSPHVKNKYSREKYEKIQPKTDLSEVEIREKIAQIYEDQEYTDTWKIYVMMKEICGIDLIDPPDIETPLDEKEAEEYAKYIKSKRPDPVKNNGVFRRSNKNVALETLRTRPDPVPKIEGSNE